jgi:hypothetical protein
MNHIRIHATVKPSRHRKSIGYQRPVAMFRMMRQVQSSDKPLRRATQRKIVLFYLNFCRRPSASLGAMRRQPSWGSSVSRNKRRLATSSAPGWTRPCGRPGHELPAKALIPWSVVPNYRSYMRLAFEPEHGIWCCSPGKQITMFDFS